MTVFPQIVVGTYEEFVLGYKLQNDNDLSDKWKFVQSFATHSHQASVRCVAANGKLMASSGADEYINIYDMEAMKIVTVINYHNSTVTCLEFTPDNTHLVTANQNGDIAIFRCKDWTLVKLWKQAHKNANGVSSISVHPTGSLLLTAGADNILRFWNLIKGRQAYATNYSKHSIGTSLNISFWSSSGKYYVVTIGTKLEVYKTDSAAVIYTVTAETKITSAAFNQKNLLFVGTEEGKLEIHSIIHKKLLIREEAHSGRLKCISPFSVSVVKNEETKIENYLITADSTGKIKLWNVKKKGLNCKLNRKAEIDCDCRIICLTIVPLVRVKEENQNDNLLNGKEGNITSIEEKGVAKKKAKNEIQIICQNGDIQADSSITENDNTGRAFSKESEKINASKKKKSEKQKDEKNKFIGRKRKVSTDLNSSEKKKKLHSNFEKCNKLTKSLMNGKKKLVRKEKLKT